MPNVELHFHLLPCVDDGPTSTDESVALARAAVEDGTDTIIATPHVSLNWPTDVTTIADRVTHLAERLRREHIALEVLPGAELDSSMVPRLTQAELELIAQGPPSNRWVLLEAPFSGLDRLSTTPPMSCAGADLALWLRIPSGRPREPPKTRACSPMNSRLAARCN